jgi:hypothetical protein
MLTELVQVLSSVKNTTDIVKLISEYSQEIKDEQKYSEFMSYISKLKLELAQMVFTCPECQLKIIDI